jgi:hypothetical protein
MDIQRADNKDSMALLGIGRENKNPCARWQLCCIKVDAVEGVSTPSATT